MILREYPTLSLVAYTHIYILSDRMRFEIKVLKDILLFTGIYKIMLS